MTFDKLFLEVAHTVAQKSKDLSTKVGCVIVGPDNEPRSFGWNGFARGVNDNPDRMTRPEKYDWTIHAEANAVANAARVGIPLKDCKAYVTHFPCKNCADMLIQSGIKCVVVGGGKVVGDHGFDISTTKFQEAGVEVLFATVEEDCVE